MYILIVTGLSGAGKSQVLGILEDMGFVCADNMPCQLAKQYIELCSSSENNIERVALVIDSRESVFGYNPLNTYDELRRLECPYEIMFLECEDSVLVRRYSETRRRHPMNDDVGIGIQTEREILIPLKEKANFNAGKEYSAQTDNFKFRLQTRNSEKCGFYLRYALHRKPVLH